MNPDALTADRLISHQAVAALFEHQPQLAVRALSLTASHAGQKTDATEAARLQNDSADLLELTLALAAIAEAVVSFGSQSEEALARDSGRIHRLATSIAGFPPDTVLSRSRHRWFFTTLKQAPSLDADSALARLDRSFEAFVLFARGAAGACPIHWLEALARDAELEDLGHRCRQAYERLRAFSVRNGPEDERVNTVGRAYSEGRLEVSEAARILGRTEPDTVALLEQNGFARSVAAIRLAPERRREVLARLGADRRKRSGQPHPSPDAVRRDVIASQRIESVDARPWLPPDAE